MSEEGKALLLAMKEREFIYDTKIGQFLNRKHEIYKAAVLELLDILYENADRVEFINDLSYEKGCALLISEKMAMMDARIPLPQVPFHIKMGGKWLGCSPCDAYFALKDYLENEDGPVRVFLNFKDKETKEVYAKQLN